MERFVSPNSGKDLRSDAHQSQIIGGMLMKTILKLLGGIYPSDPPGFRHPCIRHDKTLRTKVYCKPTHTDRYLHFDSHHPQHQKLAVTKTLYMTELTHTTPSQQMHDTKPPMFCLFYNSTVSLSGTPTPSQRSNNGTQHSILSTSPPYLMYRVLQNVSVVFLTKLV